MIGESRWHLKKIGEENFNNWKKIRTINPKKKKKEKKITQKTFNSNHFRLMFTKNSWKLLKRPSNLTVIYYLARMKIWTAHISKFFSFCWFFCFGFCIVSSFDFLNGHFFVVPPEKPFRVSSTSSLSDAPKRWASSAQNDPQSRSPQISCLRHSARTSTKFYQALKRLVSKNFSIPETHLLRLK